jgi:putative transposase
MFPWATWSRQKGAVKLHLTLDHAGYLPEAMIITTGKYSELTVARRRRYGRGTILVMDRGFVDFKWFRQLNESGVLFITRMKKDTAYEVVESHPVVEGKGLVSDERIRLTGKKSGTPPKENGWSF